VFLTSPLDKDEWSGSCSDHIATGREPPAFDSEICINLKGRAHSEDLGVDGGIILEWMLWK